MKKLLTLSLAFFILLISVSKAQIAELTLRRVELGVRFMPTISNFDIKGYNGSAVQGQATLGYGVGAMLAVNLNEHSAIQGEVIYNSLTQKYKDANTDRKIHVDYVNVPLLYCLSTAKSKPVHLSIVAGPQMGFSVGSNIYAANGSGADTAKAIFAVKNGDLGFAYGVGLGFALNSLRTYRFDIGLRGVYGFTNVSNTSAASGSNSRYVVDYAAVRTTSLYFGLTLLL